MKERFNAADWETVKVLAFHLFAAIALADGKIQKEEMKEFGERLIRGAVAYKDPLHREVAQDLIAADLSGFAKSIADHGSFDPQAAKQILKDNLTTDEYQGFLGSIFVDLINIAKASTTRKGWFRKKVEIDEAEQQRLALIGMFWEIDVGRLIQA